MNPVHVAMFHADNEYYLLMTKSGKEGYVILGWPQLSDALAYFERGYNGCHDRGYESSMSACINFIQYQPVILTFDSLEDMIQQLKLTTESGLVRLSSISGFYDVLPVKKEFAEIQYKNGTRPKLISGERY